MKTKEKEENELEKILSSNKEDREILIKIQKHLLRTKFLSPFLHQKELSNTKTEDKKEIVCKRQDIENSNPDFALLGNEEEEFLLAFTSMNEIKKDFLSENRFFCERSIFDFRLDLLKQSSGIVINPFTDKLVLDKSIIDLLFRVEGSNQKDNIISHFQKSYPVSFVQKLQDFSAEIIEIKKLYIIEKDTETGLIYQIIVDCARDFSSVKAKLLSFSKRKMKAIKTEVKDYNKINKEILANIEAIYNVYMFD